MERTDDTDDLVISGSHGAVSAVQERSGPYGPRDDMFDISIFEKNRCSMDCGIVILRGRELVFVNQALTDILGYTLDDLSGEKYLTILDLISNREGHLLDTIREAAEGEGVEIEAVTKGGDRRWVQLSHRTTGTGEEALNMVTVFDITRFKGIEKELRRSEGKYRAVLEKSPINIYIADLETLRIMETNPAMQRLLGYSEDELKEMTPYDFLEHAPDDIHRKVVGLSSLDFKVVGERKYRRKDGRLLDVEVFGNIIDLGDRKAICIVSWDITERNSASRQIMKLNEVLRLTSKITRHDIRNHLSIAYGILGIMREGHQASERFIDEAYLSVQRSIDLTKRMAVLDTMIMGEDRLYPFDVREVVESVIVDHKVKYSILGEGRVLADVALTSVIDNIVMNSVNHGQTDRMKVTIASHGGSVEVRLSDTGVGIPDEIKPKVFEEGFTFGKNAGTGLGLFIVRSAMERYGGSVRLEDTIPKGTTFVLTFKNADVNESG
ncbi:MAG: PAS domain-containing sensor histidine kinase [Candidatus Thermoplasmatota archaeon]|jgi:PAS domain S-box-containing protein|nr:PAS domain-containing sensor histidine kinase [Candidatus Thermoplasmatota archaeon]